MRAALARLDFDAFSATLDAERRAHGLTWYELASRLTNLRSARQADLALVMGVTQWLARPACAFIHPTEW